VCTESRHYLTGAAGQIGAEIVPHLRSLYGHANVISSDIKAPPRQSNDSIGASTGTFRSASPRHDHVRGSFPSTCGGFVYCDVLDHDALTRVVLEQGIDTVVHLASLLSGGDTGHGTGDREQGTGDRGQGTGDRG
jgi:nucleoside-diphosphate-sugar epimerase